MVLTHGKEKCLPASKETLTVQERSLEKAPLRKQLYEEVRGDLCSACKGPEAERASSGDGKGC